MVDVKLLQQDHLLANGRAVLRPVASDCMDQYRSLVSRSIAFFDEFEGGWPTDQAFVETFTDLPPGCSLDNKNSIGVFDADGLMVGFVDIVAGYPEEQSWYLGLLLIAQDARGHGLGAAVVATLQSLIAARGARRLYLAVYDANIPGRAFWQAMGFIPDKHAPGHTNALGELLPATRLRKELVF
jgi:ribosomal protein S18 acetylase RimI-like enzyme